jgi:hypothetical protein
MASIWAIGLTIWIPITIRYNNLDFSASLNYDPIYFENIFNSLFWLVPLLLILYFSVQIIWILNNHAAKKRHMKHKTHQNQNNSMSMNNSVAIAQNTSANTTAVSKKTIPGFRKPKKKFKLKPHFKFVLISKLYFRII